MATQRRTTTRKSRAVVAKAIDMGSSDAQLLVGTIADTQASDVADNELYYLLYKKHPWIRACIRIISNAVAQQGFAIGEVDGDDMQPIDDDDPRAKEIREFFRLAPAPKSQRQLFKATAADLELYGVAYWQKIRTGALLTGLERLDPRLIVPKLNKDRTEIDKYEVRRNQLSPTGVVVEQTASQEIDAKDVVRFALDEGGDAVFGSPSPLEALDLTTSMDLNIRKHRNSFFKNGATVGNLLINKEGNEDEVRAAVKMLKSSKVGAGNAYSNFVLTGDWQVQSMMQAGKHELDFIKSTDIVRDEICAVYSVPVSKLMNVSGAMGQAGKGEDDETFEQECVLPLEELIYEKITVEILRNEFEIDDIELVPKRRNSLRFERIQAALSGVKMGMTGNEARGLIGLAPSDAPGMDTPLFIGATGQGIVSDEIAAEPTPEANPGINAATDQIEKEQDAENEVARKGSRRFRYYR